MKIVFYHFFFILFIFFFTPDLSVSKCIINVTQPQDHLYGRLNQSISIPCRINTSCPLTAHDVTWYVFRTDSYYELDIKNHPVKYILHGTDLHINWLSHSDDGVYHCAASDRDSTNSGAQAIATGTTLTVQENYNAGQVLLFTFLVLLSLYILIVLTLFICIKTGRVLILKRRGSQNQAKSDSTKRAHFGAVVQELYSKRNLRRKKKTSTEVSQENKVENPQSRNEREGIYQNLKRTR